jgi:hypothetical protein
MLDFDRRYGHTKERRGFAPAAATELLPRQTRNNFMTPTPLDAPEILEREFLQARAKLLQVAATLDRLSRAAGSVEDDPRAARLRQAAQVLLSDDANRAEQIQMIFSRPYESDWRGRFFSDSK